MDITVIISILGLLATLSAIGVTITIFILKNIRSDNKALWTETKTLQTALTDSNKALSDFREHVALHHPNEQRINEKIEASRQHLDSALSGINRRLLRLEEEGSETLKITTEMCTQVKNILQWMDKLDTKLDAPRNERSQ